VVYVGENRGDYDEEGNEAGKNRGDYTVLYIPSEEKEPIHAVEFSWNLSIGAGLRGLGTGPAVGGWFDRIRRNVSWDSFISIIEKSRTDDLLGLYLFSPSVLQSDEQTLYGVNEFRQELGFFNAVRKVNMRLTATRRDELDNRSIEVSAERLSSEIRLRTEFVPYASFSFTLEGGMGRSDRRSNEALAQNYRVRSRFGSGTMNYRLRASTTFALELGIDARTDGVSAAKQQSYFLRPAFNSSLGKHIYVNAMLRLTYTDSESDEQKPLFFLEEGLREDWNVIGQYRLARYISFGINYNGRREKDFRGVEKTIHDFKFETRAYF
jgi:hypothetical protein